MVQPFQLLHRAPSGGLAVSLIQVRRSQLVIRDPLLAHVIDDGQDGVRHGQDRLLVAAMTHDPAIPSGPPTVFHSDRGQGGFCQGCAQPTVPLAGFAAFVLARALVMVRTNPRPTGQMSIRRKGGPTQFQRMGRSPGPSHYQAERPGVALSRIAWTRGARRMDS